MTEMFYVIYSPSKDQWLDADGNYVPFALAEQHTKPLGTSLEGDQRWVGPCKDGETP